MSRGSSSFFSADMTNGFSLNLRLRCYSSTSNQNILHTVEKLTGRILLTGRTIKAHLSSKTDWGGGGKDHRKEGKDNG